MRPRLEDFRYNADDYRSLSGAQEDADRLQRKFPGLKAVAAAESRKYPGLFLVSYWTTDWISLNFASEEKARQEFEHKKAKHAGSHVELQLIRDKDNAVIEAVGLQGR